MVCTDYRHEYKDNTIYCDWMTWENLSTKLPYTSVVPMLPFCRFIQLSGTAEAD